MAAKRLGSVLTNITGTAGQLLRVKTDESGFEFITPATIPSYTVSNKTVDRALDCSNSNIDELANVLGTLIDDLTAIGAPGSTQQVWESNEITHTNSTSGTKYTLVHNFGKVPDLVICYVKQSGFWNEADRFNAGGSNNYGYSVNYNTTDINTVYAKPFILTGDSTNTIKFRCFILGQVAQVAPFQWSTSEQVYPFERASDGSVLYCKEINMGALPNTGNLQVAHGISNFDPAKIHSIDGLKRNSADGNTWPVLSTGSGWNVPPMVYFTAVYAWINVQSDQTYFNSSVLRVIYAK
jgi:hypothetical protein